MAVSRRRVTAAETGSGLQAFSGGFLLRARYALVLAERRGRSMTWWSYVVTALFVLAMLAVAGLIISELAP